MDGRNGLEWSTNDSKGAPADDRPPDGLIRARNAPRRFWACVIIGLLLGICGRAYAGEPPSFKRAARVTLQQRHVEECEPMAFLNNTWQAIAGGNFNNTSNWTLGIVPTANHVAIFDGTSQISVTSGLDQSANAFEQLLVKPKYGGNIGSQGNPLQVDVVGNIIVWRGSGQGFINPAFGTIANIAVNVPNPFNGSRYNLVIGGTGTGTAGTISQVGIRRGNVNIMGDVNFSAQTYMLGDAARLVIDASLGGMTDPEHIFCAAGELINNRPLNTGKVLVVGDRSRVTQIGALAVTNHILVIGNGKFEYLPMSAPGTSPLISVIGGVYDQSDEKWDNVWGTTIIGPDAMIIGGALRGSNFWPASLNFGDEYPGAQE